MRDRWNQNLDLRRDAVGFEDEVCRRAALENEQLVRRLVFYRNIV